jgi:hypothetical protein
MDIVDGVNRETHSCCSQPGYEYIINSATFMRNVILSAGAFILKNLWATTLFIPPRCL